MSPLEREPKVQRCSILVITWAGFLMAGLGFYFEAFSSFLGNYVNIFYNELISGHSHGVLAINRDTYSHIAYETIREVYGLYGAGVHGLEPLKFQFGSHTMVLAFDRIFQRSPDFFNNIGVATIILPMVLQTMYSGVLALTEVKHPLYKLAVFALLIFVQK